ncbi:MAG: DUF3696 domain-containing protein [Planctomycetes bacterium]|nr:DUF3696 domain-containing protein [Planctomycetota bacterium]
MSKSFGVGIHKYPRRQLVTTQKPTAKKFTIRKSARDWNLSGSRPSRESNFNDGLEVCFARWYPVCMLRELRFKNFKIWADTGPIKLAPLTLFFGTNSSGKSSISQFLMLLKQSCGEATFPGALSLAENTKYMFQCGKYINIAHNRKIEDDIEFSYRFDLNDSDINRLHIQFPDITRKIKELSFSATVGADVKSEQGTVLRSFNYEPFDGDGKKLFSISLRASVEQITSKLLYEDDTSNASDIQNKSEALAYRYYNIGGYTLPSFGPGTKGEARTYNIQRINDLVLLNESFFNKGIRFVSSRREKLPREHQYYGRVIEDVGFHGEDSIQSLIGSQRSIAIKSENKTLSLQEIVAFELKRLKLIEDFRLREIPGRRDYFEFRVKTKGSGVYVDIMDVGSGVSQVLPAITQVFNVPEGTIVVLENPELDLHPSAQSDLADAIIDALQAEERGKCRNIQLIIESHSEHFLRRIQRRIADETIRDESVAAYFCHVTEDGAKLERLEIDEYGNIKNWPNNFFGDEMGEVLAKADAALRRKRDGSHKDKDKPHNEPSN